MEDGSTREQLLASANEVLEELGVAGLGLREVARRAGVSHNAPLRHFRSLAELRTELATRGFIEFTEATAAAGAPTSRRDPILRRAVRIGTAYVDFAVAHSGLFALMWRLELLEPTDEFLVEATRAYDVLLEFVGEAQAAGYQPTVERDDLALIIWSAVHGLSQLWPSGVMHHPSDSLPAIVEQLMTVILGVPSRHTQRSSA